jgi:hypothetical protein
MDTNIGTGQTQILIVSAASTSAQKYYFTKFVSQPLAQTNVTAQTWTYNFAAEEELGSNQFPVASSGDDIYLNIYVWRPSTGAKVGTVFDTQSASGLVSEAAAGTEAVYHLDITGSAVASAAVNDVIIAEIWFECTQSSATAADNFFYYDGTTVNTTNGATVSNHASFLETAQNLTFVTPAIDMTNASTKTFASRFITKV